MTAAGPAPADDGRVLGLLRRIIGLDEDGNGEEGDVVAEAFARAGCTPAAHLMDEAGIATAVAAGRDPWAEAAGDAAPPPRRYAPLRALRAAAGLMRVLPDPGTAPDGVVLLRLPDEKARRKTAEALRRIVLPCLQPRDVADETGCVAETVHGGFKGELDDALAAHRRVLALASGRDALSCAGLCVLAAEHDWPAFCRDDAIMVLRATHSDTGLVAEAVLRDALPSDDALARLPWAVIAHAWRADTTLRVAARLAAARLPEPDPKPEPKPETGVPGRTLDDVKGLPDVVERMRGLVEDTAAWRDGGLAWEDVASSVLLFGPPGTGKTMLAEAVAGSVGGAFVATSFAECQKAGHLDDYLREMDAAVRSAIGAAPAVFFIDELDSYPARRTGPRNDRYMTSVVNGMLEQLTRLNDAPGVIVMAATNHPERVDPALVRAGRFDLKVAVGHPDRAGAAEILRTHLGAGGPEIGTDRADRLIGLSGAEIAAVARDAKGRARRDRAAADGRHLDAALDAVVPELPAGDVVRVAWHEAGHLVACHALGLAPAKRAFVTPRGGGVEAPGLGPVMTRRTAENELAGLMAGRAAERLRPADAPEGAARDPALPQPGEVSGGAGGDEMSDLGLATALAIDVETRFGLGESLVNAPAGEGSLPPPPDLRDRVEARLRAAEARADEVLAANRDLLARVAAALAEARELDEAALRALLGPRPRDPVRAAGEGREEGNGIRDDRSGIACGSGAG